MKKKVLIVFLMLGSLLTAKGQSEIYPQHFDLSEVTLLDGPLKTAMDKNISLLLQYDVDRLLTPYVRQSGLSTGNYAGWEASHSSFPNWGSSDFNLDGHVGGHYLSALSLAYAACHDASTKTQLKSRLDYMVGVMKDCQAAYDSNTEGLKGFIGGQPMNDAWKALYQNSNIALRGTGNCAVPWYVQHKIMAGLRDAYLYGGNSDAREVFLKLCDWAILVTSRLSDTQMQQMLDTEHGGVNESLLDAYGLTGDSKYLDAAKRFTHKTMLNGMQTLATSFLDNKHANTQVPKYIGMERIGEADNSATNYLTAAGNFWQDVATNRTVCIGGNSMSEHFISAGNGAVYIDNLDGPESCNTNNMMKLSEMMADRTHDARYADFYEYAMWNHILSTQDPTTGGYVYFTTLRPQGYRIYSTVNQSMWCCVGTGMENHSKYGHFVYTHDGTNTLYINLFTPSKLEDADFAVTQETTFPFEAQTRITVHKAGTYAIAVRHPAWVGASFQVKVNDTAINTTATKGTASYVTIDRTWAKGDVITVDLPMELRYTACPNYTDYIAFQYGPILLAAQTTASSTEEATATGLAYEALQNEYGHEGRMDHAPGSRATRKSLTSAPLLIGERANVLSKITPTDLTKLRFTLDASRQDAPTYTWTTLTLQPFYQIHHARYSCYWYQQTPENFANSTMAAEEAAAAAVEERTLDFVGTGEQQSEAGHYVVSQNSTTGVYNDEHYRDARPTDGYLQYTLSYEGEPIASGLSVLCRFTVADAGRKATLYVDDTPIANITALAAYNGANEKGFYNVEFPIPASLMKDGQGNVKQSFTVRLAADKGVNAPGLYYLRLMKEYDDGMPATITTSHGDQRNVVDGVTTGDNGQSDMSHGMDFNANIHNENYGTYSNKYWRNARGGQYYGYDLWTGGQTDGVSLVVEYNAVDGGRLADIAIDGVKLATQEVNNFFSGFVTVEYPVDAALLQGKERIHVAFSSVNNSYTPGTYNVYLTTGRTTTARTRTPYTFVPENFEKNDGNITSMTYPEGTIQIASGGGNNQINMRMKTSVKDNYSILPDQFLFLVKGRDLATNAYMWWLMGCNHGTQDAPTATLTDGQDVYLVWDLRRSGVFNAAEKTARFFGVGEVPVTTTIGDAYSLLCMGLTSSNGGNATLTDINFYSPEQLVDKYAVLKNTVASMASALTTGSQFAYGNYVYQVTDATHATALLPLSTGGDAATSVFGYTVAASALESHRQVIRENHGDATSLVTNPTCESALGGWTKSDGNASGYYTAPRTWRNASSSHLDNTNVRTTVSQTLTDMPAGYYRVVAAMRANTGSAITVNLNGQGASRFTGFGDAPTTGSQININGVQMPYTVASAYAEGTGRGWQWNAAKAHLETDGSLTINFVLDGNSWMAIDDVHLYYSETEDGFCSITSDDCDVPEDKVLTCDIVLTNPNTIISSTSAIVTASGASLNNNLVDGTIQNLVLVDGYDFPAPTMAYAATQATLYRTLPANQWATLVVPFVPTQTLTCKLPQSLSEGTLNFGDATPVADQPMLVQSATALTALTGSRPSLSTGSLTAGLGAPMQGLYQGTTSLTQGNYVVARKDGADRLFRVNNDGVRLNAFRAYFALSDQNIKAETLNLNFGGVEDGVSAPGIETSAPVCYNLAGQRLNKLQRGVNIVKGKKIIVK